MNANNEPFIGFMVYDDEMDRCACFETKEEADRFAETAEHWTTVIAEEVVWVEMSHRRGDALVSAQSPVGQRAITGKWPETHDAGCINGP